MTNIVRPEADAPVDRMKLHKDLVWVIRVLAGLIVVSFLAGVWATTLASDVANNTKELEKKADQQTVESIVSTLERIEGKIDDADKRQRDIAKNVAKLEQAVDDLKNE